MCADASGMDGVVPADGKSAAFLPFRVCIPEGSFAFCESANFVKTLPGHACVRDFLQKDKFWNRFPTNHIKEKLAHISVKIK